MKWPDEATEEMKRAIYAVMDRRGIRLSEDDVIDIYDAMRKTLVSPPTESP